MGDTSADAAVLADVLAFLDQFEVEDGRGQPQKPSASSPAPQLALEPSASPEKQSSSRKPRKEANAQARNQARLELYRRKKQEMQALRSQVESLSRRLEIMKGCATSSLEASVADALSVTIRRSRVDWKRIAEREKALRMETEQTNVDLKKLVRMQQKWVSDISSQLEFWQGGTIKRGLTDFTPPQGSPFEPLPSNSTYSSALHSLLEKVDQFSEQDPLSALKNIDWDNAASEMRPSATWSSSFQIPVADPESVGVAWWQAIQTADNLQGILTEEVTMECKHQQEIVKKAVWSVANCSSDSIRFVGFISFQLKTEPGVRCVLSARGDIFDATGTSLLFRTSAVRVVTPARTKTTPSCLFRAQYSVYDTGISELLRDAPDTIARLKEHVEVGISAWKEKMRLKDQHMRLRFVGL